VLRRAIGDARGLDGQYTVTEAALDHIVRIAGGDARRALTARMSSSVSERSCSTSDRDSSGETTENEGFSVVAPTSSTI
nr:hypothetical protein [Nocardia cyriacigeorgica]